MLAALLKRVTVTLGFSAAVDTTTICKTEESVKSVKQKLCTLKNVDCHITNSLANHLYYGLLHSFITKNWCACVCACVLATK